MKLSKTMLEYYKVDELTTVCGTFELWENKYRESGLEIPYVVTVDGFIVGITYNGLYTFIHDEYVIL